MKKYLGIILISIFLLGCNTNVIKQDFVSQLITAPEIRGVQLKTFSVEEQSVVFDVSLYNPNPFPLPISGLNGDFQLNQISVGSMAAKSDKSLGAQKTQTITLPIQLNTAAFMNAAKKALSTQKASYRFNGGVETPAGKLPFSKTGNVSLSDIISALLP
ncbi:MAG: LEA14-like dessication related protein [Oceanospirillaceae bacterium]|jgi:LEA14-like dessication related protein